ncbi:ribosome biogenesis factor YjgA [Methyloversatilis universalis]|uniref:ribosome biogenesis factor YjgA n=1 Tax=Methyloversatilis universalis TaxID=378211 RepID=UPI000366CB25|nr:ribosome biogenesis factor YjgA [Methyloversatilis universalis]
MRPKSISTTENPDDQDLPDRPSKSQKKRDAHALQDIGTQLVALSAEQLKRIDMPDSLRIAIAETQRTRSHEGLRRQMQYVGKVMRGIDTAPLIEALDVIRGQSAAAVAREHMLERMRERLMADEQVLGDIATQWPGADLTRLRTLRRNALREREQNRPPRAFREIFRELRQLDNAARGEEAEADADSDSEQEGYDDE